MAGRGFTEREGLMQMPQEAAARFERRAAWMTRVVMAFILLSLMLLVVTPALIERRVVPLREQVVNAESGRTAVGVVEFNLAMEMSALRGYLLSGDSSYLRTYTQSVRAEQAAYPRLAALTRPLDAPARLELDSLRAASTRWHQRASNEEIVRRRLASPRLLASIPTEQALFEQALRSAGALDQALVGESQRRRDSIQRWERLRFGITAVLVLFAAGSALAAGWFARRVRMLARESAARRYEAEAALAELRRTSESRARMMRGVTHDLKNPLGAARGYADLMNDGVAGEITPRQREMVVGVRRNVDHALGIIQDLLDVARAEAGTLDVSPQPVDCALLLRETVEEYRGAADASGHALEVRAPDGGLVVHTDPQRVRQIVGNLVSNALKYTPQGSRVVVQAAPADGAAPRPGEWAVLRVDDSGPGVPPEHREVVFDEFHRLEPSGKVAGHGMGLAISRHIARLLGGDLTVDQAELGGASFRLWLPLTRPDEGARRVSVMVESTTSH